MAPLINAAGRMSHATAAVKRLCAPTEQEATPWLTQLTQENDARRELDAHTTAQAFQVGSASASRHGLVLYHPNWAKGIVGIVAARCVEYVHRPTIVLTQENDLLTGSGRALTGYNLYQALQRCAPLLHKYGGHQQAVGLSLAEDKLQPFSKLFDAEVAATMTEADRIPHPTIDLTLSTPLLSAQDLHLLQRMAPFGPSFREPIFATQRIKVARYFIYQEKHVKLHFKSAPGRTLPTAIGFNMAYRFQTIYAHTPYLAIAYKVVLNRYQGVDRLQLVLKDIKAADA